MQHGCKHTSSWDNAGTVYCTEQDCIFNVIQSAQMDICHICTFPDANFCAVLSKDIGTDSHQCAEAAFPDMEFKLNKEKNHA